MVQKKSSDDMIVFTMISLYLLGRLHCTTFFYSNLIFKFEVSNNKIISTIKKSFNVNLLLY